MARSTSASFSVALFAIVASIGCATAGDTPGIGFDSGGLGGDVRAMGDSDAALSESSPRDSVAPTDGTSSDLGAETESGDSDGSETGSSDSSDPDGTAVDSGDPDTGTAPDTAPVDTGSPPTDATKGCASDTDCTFPYNCCDKLFTKKCGLKSGSVCIPAP